MKAFQTEVLTDIDIPQLVSLQIENLKTNISSDTANDQGFLTFQYSDDFVKEMMQDMEQPIAKSGDVLCGYALATSVETAWNNELLKPLVQLCNSIVVEGKSLSQFQYYLMGQICVKDGYRGLGIFDAMYQKHKELFAPAFDFLVTEISVHNKRSLAAHQRVGFKIVHQYVQDVTEWNVVVWNLK